LVQVGSEEFEDNDEVGVQVEALDELEDQVRVPVLLDRLQDLHFCFGCAYVFGDWFDDLPILNQSTNYYFHGEVLVFGHVVGLETTSEGPTSQMVDKVVVFHDGILVSVVVRSVPAFLVTFSN
jgi:hypothetical protein